MNLLERNLFKITKNFQVLFQENLIIIIEAQKINLVLNCISTLKKIVFIINYLILLFSLIIIKSI
jgi:hypothetical protein